LGSGGAIGIGAGGIIKALLSHNFAVAVGAESFVEGRMLTAGAIAFGPGTISLPVGLLLLTLEQ
jgi:hypothetical protein